MSLHCHSSSICAGINDNAAMAGSNIYAELLPGINMRQLCVIAEVP
jgi:hypothetical protein